MDFEAFQQIAQQISEQFKQNKLLLDSLTGGRFSPFSQTLERASELPGLGYGAGAIPQTLLREALPLSPLWQQASPLQKAAMERAIQGGRSSSPAFRKAVTDWLHGGSSAELNRVFELMR